MPSGKRSRERRSVPPPPVRSKSRPGSSARPAARSSARVEPTSRRASPRVLLAGAAIVLAAVIAIVVALVLGGSKHTPITVPRVGSLAAALPGAADVHTLFAGIPQHGTTLGSPKAPVTLVEYVDLQCPYCQQFETQVLPDLVQKYVRPGKLRVVFRPWVIIGPDSIRGQAAALAAAKQNKAFDFAEVTYDNQGTENTGWLNQNMVVKVASSVPGLLVRKLLTDLSSSSVKAEAQQIDSLAVSDKVAGTPTIFVGKTGTHGKEVILPSVTDPTPVVQAIKAAGG